MTFEEIGLKVPEILLPKKGADMAKWAVIACDQYTSQKEYWEKVGEFVGDSPSTLNIILPEAYLAATDIEEAGKRINKAMREYVDSKFLQPRRGFILVDRTTSVRKSRKGLVVALDLEMYEYKEGSKTLIRTTEGTYIDKVRPRVKIREHAPIETPHILVLIDDPEYTVIEPLFKKKLEMVYDFDLMMDAGHISGYIVDDEKTLGEISESLKRLADPEKFGERFATSDKSVILYAMGDGNHSFATAKTVWNRLKEEATDKKAIMSHPARHCLVEIVNIHDVGLQVEPIHRIVFNVDAQDMFKEMRRHLKAQGSDATITALGSETEALKELKEPRKAGTQRIPYTAAGSFGLLTVKDSRGIEIETLDRFIEGYIKDKPDAKLTFIHGEDVITELGSKPNTVGFYLRGWSKYEIFQRVIRDGPFPKKTFSLGHADDKKFYVECRKII